MQGKYPSRIGEFGIILPQYTWSQHSRSSQWRGSHASKWSCHQKLEVSICIWSKLHCHQADCISSWSAKSRSLYSEGGTNFHFHKIKQAISEFQINLKIVLCGLWFMVYGLQWSASLIPEPIIFIFFLHFQKFAIILYHATQITVEFNQFFPSTTVSS